MGKKRVDNTICMIYLWCYLAMHHSEGLSCKNILEVLMHFIYCTIMTFGNCHVSPHCKYRHVIRNNFSPVFQCHCSYMSSTEEALLHTREGKKIFCVLKQHRGYLGHRRKLLLSWLECLVRLKRIKSLKINELFKRHSESECADQSSIGSIPQRIVRLDKCGFFLVCHLILSL